MTLGSRPALLSLAVLLLAFAAAPLVSGRALQQWWGQRSSWGRGSWGRWGRGGDPAAQDPTQQQQPSTGAPVEDAAYGQQALDRHNLYRSQHSTAPLLWSPELETAARAWAQRCVFEHDLENTEQGENLAWGFPDPASAIDAFYAEGAGYAYSADPADPHAVGHFTQACVVIWVASTHVACAAATCASGQIFHVCRYSPPGNVIGEFADNVRPPAAA
ncbi:hypothetical protein HYH03_007731 [Edaphochlamys debaryana]|uniref:SCP domain-containing protein n=1 Tax=Edaphochlamys debaryana TaxID=47281 RepID=A0A835Y2N9_9CHLO|nr:hypothetical protein HYH03_007731 [Edaphochlamys debaryana]|eukprot:KAG2494092.1 hypothetical protein HYH03_007731 [Edaphochlamys debaryana]